MKIELGEKHILNCDPLCYYVTVLVESEGKKTYERRVSGYYGTLEGVFENYIDRHIGSLNCETIVELIDEVKKLKVEVREMIGRISDEKNFTL